MLQCFNFTNRKLYLNLYNFSFHVLSFVFPLTERLKKESLFPSSNSLYAQRSTRQKFSGFMLQGRFLTSGSFYKDLFEYQYFHILLEMDTRNGQDVLQYLCCMTRNCSWKDSLFIPMWQFQLQNCIENSQFNLFLSISLQFSECNLLSLFLYLICLCLPHQTFVNCKFNQHFSISLQIIYPHNTVPEPKCSFSIFGRSSGDYW